MGEQGLAASGMQSQDETRMMIEKIMEALMSGITPEELLQKGVPEELLNAAMQELQARQSQNAQSQIQPMQGLAAGM